MWNLKCKIIPVINGATGIVTKGLRKKIGSHTRITFSRFTTKEGCICNIKHNTNRIAVGITRGSREVPGRKDL
jgi:hypothetical protein